MPTREELEFRKLELEVRDLSRPPWMRAVYIAALLPAILALVTFLSAWMSGYFDRERIRLKQETIQLRSDRDSLKAERVELQASLDALTDQFRESTERLKMYDEFVARAIEMLVGPSATPSPSPPP